MSQITVKIDPKHRLSEGRTEETIEAEVVGRFLAVHANVTADVGGFSVTHIPTGLQLGNYVAQEYASYVADKLAELGDVWDFGALDDISEELQEWAAAGYLKASDNNHVRVPQRPAFLPKDANPFIR